ncbi:MAG TPA: protein kinase [Acidimicrobiales bacterium]|nr:protein kinase [Acidimicrobiales bacterium]
MTGRLLAGRYRLVKPIAKGGMAEVWEGHDEVLARPVAVKVLHRHLADADEFVERFRREAVAAARLAHPGIVATFDTGTDGDLVFIVMELVPGRTLSQALAEGTRLEPTVAVHVAAEVADALDHAHQAGLIHRDVKPANILLVEDAGDSRPVQVKVADFGIAKMQNPDDAAQLTATGAVVGTAKYLAPEQVVGGDLDRRTDVYAVGVVLYEMLCGQPPFQADTELATAIQRVRSEPPPPGELCPNLPRGLEAVVMRAIAKDREDRFPSAGALRAALLQLDVGGHALEPVEPVPPPGDETPAPAPPRRAVQPASQDDAVPLVVRDPTPPAGVRPVARPARRGWVPLAVVILLAGLVGAAAITVLDDRDGGTAGSQAEPSSRQGPVEIASVSSFDPEGPDGSENPRTTANAHDGDPDTAWTTDRYNTRNFGALKSGVGLTIRLEDQAELGRLEVRSSTNGWAASVYVRDEPGRRLSDWGPPVATRSGIRGGTEFDLGGRRGGAVLLWITDPGTRNQAEVAEVRLTG